MDKILSELIANEYRLSFLVKNVHWNYKGANFLSIHKQLDEIYDEITESIDLLAERLRQLDYPIFVDCNFIDNHGTIDILTLENTLDDVVENLLVTNYRISDITNQLQKDLVTQDILIGIMRKRARSIYLLESINPI